jgi:hypothetical protein
MINRVAGVSAGDSAGKSSCTSVIFVSINKNSSKIIKFPIWVAVIPAVD